MTKRARLYIWGVILVGIILGPFAVYRYITGLGQVDLSLEIQQMVCLIALCALCRSQPIYINSHHAIDVSVIGILSTVLLKGPYAGVTVYLVSSLFTVDHDKETGQYHHIYNTPPTKTLFNLGNLVVSILLPGLLIQWMGGTVGVVELPGDIGRALIFAVGTFVLNAVILMTMFSLNGQLTSEEALEMMKGLLPNVLASMPLGILMAMLFQVPAGHWIAILMLAPLMLARHAWALYLDSKEQHKRLIYAFVSAMEAKDKYTEGHSRRVAQYALKIARELRLPKERVENIEEAAMLHDIGKIGIADDILQKPGRLSEEEMNCIRRHPQIGVDIVGKVGLSEPIRDMILHHHEFYAGGGYPDGFDHTRVSFDAYILGVADAFDAMTSDRPYRKGMDKARALSILQKESGHQFHPEAVKAMIAVMEREGESG